MHNINGTESYLETYFEIVSIITENLFKDSGNIVKYYSDNGRGGMYTLAKEWANEYEELNNGREWDGEFMEDIHSYTIEKINQL